MSNIFSINTSDESRHENASKHMKDGDLGIVST
jgi:hypothetical protein